MYNDDDDILKAKQNKKQNIKDILKKYYMN